MSEQQIPLAYEEILEMFRQTDRKFQEIAKQMKRTDKKFSVVEESLYRKLFGK